MRLLLGFLLLLALFALALTFQNHSLRAAEAAGSDGAVAVAEGEAYPSDWGRVIVGRPSGAAPLVVQPEAAPIRAVHASAPASAGPRAAPAPTPAPAREFELTLQPGQTLSVVCQAHYHSARPALVSALARYNRIDDPSRVRAGQRLRLPPEAQLLKP